MIDCDFAMDVGYMVISILIVLAIAFVITVIILLFDRPLRHQRDSKNDLITWIKEGFPVKSDIEREIDEILKK
jgi:hypothetical protein